VVAIDEGESPATVRSYLQRHPRACQVALDESKQIPRRFGAHGYPYYVLMDGAGRIVGRQSGSGGKQSLLALLRQGGLSVGGEAPPGVAPASANGSGPKTYEFPGVSLHRHHGIMQAAGSSKPIPKTVFILASGERLESDHYTMDLQNLHLTVGGGQRTIALSEVDRKATAAANRKRGVQVQFPSDRNQVFIAF
jgi:hypothetical protein